MTNTKAAVEAAIKYLGFPAQRVGAVAVALTEGGVLPAGGPGKSPELETDDVISLVIGSALDVPLRAVADAVRHYRAMTPGGVSLIGAPSSLRTAGDELDIWADMAAHEGSKILRKDIIEIVSSWPEIAITDGVNARMRRFVPRGALATHWAARGHRKVVQINGAALVDATRTLFAKE